jgi:ATP-dependent helicase HrpA
MTPPLPDLPLDRCLKRDQVRLRREIDRLKGEALRGNDIASRLVDLTSRIHASVALRDARAASVPRIRYPEELPVSACRQEIHAAIQAHPVVIVCGETGSGKTTQLPKICLEAGRGISGLIGHTQPRRLAARTVAARIAEELGQPIGATVGYKVRFQDRTSPHGLIKLMTDGILLAETQGDRHLDAYDTLIIDEAHERSLNIDFLLGYLSWLLPRRPDLKIIITSATIDPERFSRHFSGAPIINVSGRSYPVEIRYRPVEIDEDDDETDGPEQQAILNAVDELWREQNGDILVFLSGEREIRETSESLRKRHPEHCEILPLYSRLSQAEQEKVFRPGNRRRVVLATNVAETSLTVPGIRAVIDTGHARISRYSHRSRLQRLPIEKISRASANQRSGRCGRVGPGIAIRLYSEEDYLARPEYTDPEIQRTNLAAVILQMHALKLGDIARFPFVEPPDDRYIRDGQRTLQELGALREDQTLTDVGRRLAQLPVDPRLGRILLAGAAEQCLDEIAVIVAAMGIPDPRDRPADKPTQADQKHALFRDPNSDFLSLLKLWQAWTAQKTQLSRAKLRAWCKEHFLSYLRMTEWHDIHGQILEVLKGELGLKLNSQPASYDAIHRALLAGLLTFVCQRKEQGEYLGARGTKVHIHPGSGQFKSKPAWIVCAEQVETTKVYARMVARVEPEWIERAGAHLVRHQHYEPHWERKAARVAVYERTTLYGLTIQSGRKIPFERIDPAEARRLFIRHALVQMDYDSKAAFFLHNLTLLQDAEYLQQKGRRVDILADEAQLYAFFDSRIPQEVSSGASFERWRRQAEALQPDLLYLRTQDISPASETGVNSADFPDHIQAGPLRIALQYRFEPGHEEDGVTAIVPLHMLKQLSAEPFGWLVPGLLEEKVTALVRSLPKHLRVHFVPVPEHVQRVLPMLDPGHGSLYVQLSKALHRSGGVTVSPDAFRDELLPLHLRVNYALVDEANRVIDSSRDLRELKLRHGQSADRNFQVLARETRLQTGCRTWTFGDLADAFDGSHDGQRIHGYVGLMDEGQTVGVGVFATPPEAIASHQRGIARLIRLVLSKELKPLLKDLAVNVQGELAYRQLTGKRSLREDVLDLIVRAVFIEDQAPLRQAGAFEQRIASQRGGIGLPAQEISRSVQQTLESWAMIKSRIKDCRIPALRDDVTTQTDRLVPQDLLQVTPWGRLKELPRYLKAILHRLERAPADPARDAKTVKEAEAFETRYWQSVRSEPGAPSPIEDPFRWLLEEYRVSLFAQQLKTAVPVSAKRLAEAWGRHQQQLTGK